MRLLRLAALAVAAPLVLASATPAAADPLPPSCYGAGSFVFCDPRLVVDGVTVGWAPTPVCAGPCWYVDTPKPTVTYEYRVCVAYNEIDGYPREVCAVDFDLDSVTRPVACVIRPSEWC